MVPEGKRNEDSLLRGGEDDFNFPFLPMFVTIRPHSPELAPCVKPDRMTLFPRSHSQRDEENETDLDIVEGRFVGDVIEQKQS